MCNRILTKSGGFAILDVPRNKVDQTDLLRERPCKRRRLIQMSPIARPQIPC
jgi:hypothetical protein